MELTSRERLTRLFNSQDIDRVPIWLLAPYHRFHTYADIYNIECYKPIIEVINKYCDTLDRRGYDRGFCYNGNPEILGEYFKQDFDGKIYNGHTIRYKDIEITKKMVKTQYGKKIKYYLEEAEDLYKILEIPYVFKEPDVSKYEQEKAELGDKGLMMIDIGDPLGPLYNICSAEDFSIWSLTDYDVILDFADEMYKRVYELYKFFLDRNIGEVFFLVGTEFAGPPLVSPDKFNEMSVKYVKGIVDLIRSYGKKSIVHYHGNLLKVRDGMKEINPDGLHTIEAPPIGDCTITQAREKLGDMILIGNIQYDDLTRLPSEQIEQMVKDAVEEGKSGRFILSPTAGPYEQFLSEQAVKNYQVFVEAGIKYGKL